MLTIKELKQVVESTGKSVEDFSLSLGRSKKFIYVVYCQYAERPIIGQRVSSIIYAKYPKQTRAIIGDERADILKMNKVKTKSPAGRKVGSKSYAAKSKAVAAKLKKNCPEIYAKLSAAEILKITKAIN